MIETMCRLKMCFSSLFFDMQEHLMIHLVDYILTLGTKNARVDLQRLLSKNEIYMLLSR
jgi:hypothetical protein